MGLPVGWAGVSVNLKYADEPLAEILEKVSADSGFMIVVNGQGRDTRISGEISDRQLEDALRKILKRFNYTIVWDEQNKQIMITVYDGAPKSQSGDLTPSMGEGAAPTQSYSYTVDPSGNRKSDPFRQGDPGTQISGEGIRFIQGTRTTGP